MESHKKIKYYLILPEKGERGSERSTDVRNWISKLNLTDDIHKADVILVVGGDGAILSAANSFNQLGKIILGINRGTLGFLLNDMETHTGVPVTFNDIHSIFDLELMKVEMIKENDELIKGCCFNEVVICGDASEYYTFNIGLESGELVSGNVKGSGLIISTTQGFTGQAIKFWPSVGLIPLNSRAYFIGGIGTGRHPSEYIDSQRIEIEISNRNNPGYRPIFLDGRRNRFDNIKKVILSPSGIFVKLAFIDDKNSLTIKRNKLVREM